MTTAEAAKLPVMLTTLRLPTIARLWQELGARADREGWGAARFLATLCEHEIQDRHTRRIARHLAEADLPAGKTLATFEFAAVPSLRKAHVLALASGDAWLDQGANILLFGPSGTGKSHLAAAIGTALVENGYRVLCKRCFQATALKFGVGG
jgi:DNA replication protein DnaC